jgi:hypothetical protein
MDEVVKLLEQIAELGKAHAWVPLAGVVVGLMIRLVKDDKLVAWFPVTIAPQYRAWTAVFLGIISGVLDKVIGGGSLATALIGGLLAALTAISGNELVVEPVNRAMANRKINAGMFPPVAMLMLCLAMTGCRGPLLNDVKDVTRNTANTVQEACDEAESIVAALHFTADVFFQLHPDADKQAKVNGVFADVALGVAAARGIAAGATEITDNDYNAAFAQFRTAWNDLVKILHELNIVEAPAIGGRFAVARRGGGTFDMPVPRASILRGK